MIPVADRVDVPDEAAATERVMDRAAVVRADHFRTVDILRAIANGEPATDAGALQIIRWYARERASQTDHIPTMRRFLCVLDVLAQPDAHFDAACDARLTHLPEKIV